MAAFYKLFTVPGTAKPRKDRKGWAASAAKQMGHGCVLRKVDGTIQALTHVYPEPIVYQFSNATLLLIRGEAKIYTLHARALRELIGRQHYLPRFTDRSSIPADNLRIEGLDFRMVRYA